MKRNLRFKTFFIVAVVLICIYGIIGLPKSRAELADNWNKSIHLGLDLKGGTHLVMQVQLQDAFKAVADNIIYRMKDEMRKQGMTAASVERNDPNRLEDADKIEIDVKGVDPTKAGSFRSLVSENFPDWVLTPLNATDYKLTLKPSEVLRVKQDAMTQTIHTIQRKIDGLGLAETTVVPTGRSNAEAELLVEMPGVDDSAHVKQLLQTQAVLEWDEVKDGPFASKEEAYTKHGGVLPLNTKLVPSVSRGGQPPAWFLVSRTPVVSGTDLRDAHTSQGDFGRWNTNFVLTQDAAKRFERYTEQNIGNRAAIVVDGQALSVPVIKSTIRDTGQIEGAASQEEASDLALNLRAGSLPAGIVYQEERTVGPSLGADSIRDGFRAGIGGLLAVVAVMLFYYRRAGVNATLALVLNAIILLAALSYFGATLTLPGIAGFILTIGMAVDSNVLIFERIREELRAGKAVAAAVDAGFSKAFLTIIDTHVTTVVSCAFLFIFGTGPVKGFAVTLVIGLIANVFTAVFVSKTIFDFELSGAKQQTALSI